MQFPCSPSGWLLGCFGAELTGEQADGRRQVALLPAAVDFADHGGQCHLLAMRDFLQAAPERVFETDAGLVAGDDDRTFDNQ